MSRVEFGAQKGIMIDLLVQGIYTEHLWYALYYARYHGVYKNVWFTVPGLKLLLVKWET